MCESPIISGNNNNKIFNFNNVNNNEDDDEEFVQVVQDYLAGSVVSSSKRSEVITVVKIAGASKLASTESRVRKIKGKTEIDMTIWWFPACDFSN